MLVIQQNCRKKYKYTIGILKARLGLDALVVYIQEPFLGNQNLSHMSFNLYWSAETTNWKDIQVLIAVQKDILSGVIVEHQTNWVGHPYYMILNIKKL